MYNQLGKDASCIQLLSLHNVYFLIDILREFRQAVIDGCAEEYMINFVTQYFINEKDGKISLQTLKKLIISIGIPEWVIEACKAGGINIDQ